MLNGCTTMLSLLLWIAWHMDLRNDFNLVKFHIHPVTFIALTLSSRYCRLHECLWPVVHRQGCGRVELGSFWRLKASLDTKKQISSVLEDLLFDAISVCVCVRFVHTKLCDTSTILANWHVDHQSCPEVRARCRSKDQSVFLNLKKRVDIAWFKEGCKQKKGIFVPYLTSIYNMHIA